MNDILKIITEKPEYVAWIFGVVNALWIVFLYFNKKRHEKELIKVKPKKNSFRISFLIADTPETISESK